MTYVVRGRVTIYTSSVEGLLSIIATCIAHDVNPRAYLHLVTKLIVRGWPNSKLRDLLPDHMLAVYPELYVGDREMLPSALDATLLPAPA